MPTWKITYYCQDESENTYIEKWLDRLTKEQLKSVAKELKLLEFCGNELRLPHSRSLGKGLFELRERNFGHRIYYGFLPNGQIVLLHAGDKKSQKKDIQTAWMKLNATKEIAK